MSRFVEVIRSNAERLALPQPARCHVLVEMAADLEDMYALYRAQGMGEEEAHRRAVENFDLSDESLAALAAVHRNPVRRLLDSLSAEALARWEYGLLTVLVLVTVLLGARLVTGRVFTDAGFYVWPVLLAGLVALLLAGGKAYQLYLKQDHDLRRAARGLDPLLRVVVLLPFLGFMGSWVEAIRLVTDADPALRPGAATLLAWALQATALFQISFGLGVIGALAWFLLAGKVGRIERAEAAVFMDT